MPPVTALYAAILALIYAALSGWVVAGRVRFRTNHGDGGNAALNRRIRAHGNFAEYVPLILLLSMVLEMGGFGPTALHALLALLVIARIMHPIGMVAREASLQQFLCRGLSAIITWAVMLSEAVLILVRAFVG